MDKVVHRNPSRGVRRARSSQRRNVDTASAVLKLNACDHPWSIGAFDIHVEHTSVTAAVKTPGVRAAEAHWWMFIRAK